jgi:hypothetical protein
MSVNPLSPITPINHFIPVTENETNEGMEIRSYTDRGVVRRLFTDENENELKEYCYKAIEIIEEISGNIPEGKYIELVNIIHEIHKKQ